MEKSAWNPCGGGSRLSAQWLIRRIALNGIAPNASFAERISAHPVMCWLDNEGCLFIATPAVPVQDGSALLDSVEKRIGELENDVKRVLAEQRLLSLIKKDEPD
jgi:hypothetical protein